MTTFSLVTKSMMSLIGVTFIALQAIGAAQATTLTFTTSTNTFNKQKNQGFYDNAQTSATNTNDSYIVGTIAGLAEFRDYFTFDLSTDTDNTPNLLSLLQGPIDSVQLVLSPGVVTSDNPVDTVAVNFGSVATDATTLNTATGSQPAIFNDLAAGNGNYGTFNVPLTPDETTPVVTPITFTLSPTAINDIQSLVGSSSTNKFFSIGGSLIPSAPDITEVAFGSTDSASLPNGIQELIIQTPTPTPGVPEPDTVGEFLLAGFVILGYSKKIRGKNQKH